jgi:hypothetical protein
MGEKLRSREHRQQTRFIHFVFQTGSPPLRRPNGHPSVIFVHHETCGADRRREPIAHSELFLFIFSEDRCSRRDRSG